jgi:tRNA dimethylallyltransferase
MPELARDESATSGPLVVLVGPTGVGKSDYAVRLAKIFSGEIVNADSRQVYRHMDVGTAKPCRDELSEVPHHLFDIVDPDQDFNLAEFLRLAGDKITDIQRRGRMPFLVGGSGQYIWGLLEGWQIPSVAPNMVLRKQLENVAASGRRNELYAQLISFDPQAARNIDSRNVRRVIRALEVAQSAGMPFSFLRKKIPPAYRVLIIGLTAERKSLYQKTDARVEKMFMSGLVDETRKLCSMGYGFDLSSMNSIGYKQVGQLLDGEITTEEAKNAIKIDTHRFIRHQYAWFKLKDPRIKWFDAAVDVLPEMMGIMEGFLS